MIYRSRQTLLSNILPLLILISALPLTRSLLLLPIKQGSPFSFMVLEVLARLMSTRPSAITCAQMWRLFFALHPVAFLHFYSLVVVLAICASRSLFPFMRPPFATSLKPLNWLIWWMKLNWLFGMKHPCNTVISWRQWIALLEICVTVTSPLVVLPLSFVTAGYGGVH